MKLETYKEYTAEKAAFFQNHDNDFRVDTSPLQGTVYFKTYYFKDGAVWYERMEKKTFRPTVEVMCVPVKVYVDMLETEYWNTDDSTSKLYYEKY